MEALIFDFDGVIADSEPVHERAITRVAQMLGVPFTHDDYMTRIIGLDDRDTFRVIAEMGGLLLVPERLAEIVSTKQSYVLEMIDQGEVKAFPGTIRLIRESARALPIAVCSGAARVEIERILERFELLDLFRHIVTADDVEQAKPDPAGYRMTAEKLGVAPADCVTIEDTPTGLTAAKSAGLKVVGVCHSVSAAEMSQADLVVESSEQITMDMLRSV